MWFSIPRAASAKPMVVVLSASSSLHFVVTMQSTAKRTSALCRSASTSSRNYGNSSYSTGYSRPRWCVEEWPACKGQVSNFQEVMVGCRLLGTIVLLLLALQHRALSLLPHRRRLHNASLLCPSLGLEVFPHSSNSNWQECPIRTNKCLEVVG